MYPKLLTMLSTIFLLFPIVARGLTIDDFLGKATENY